MSLSGTYRQSDTTFGLYVLFYIDPREEMGRGTHQCSEKSDLCEHMSDASLEKEGWRRQGVLPVNGNNFLFNGDNFLFNGVLPVNYFAEPSGSALSHLRVFNSSL